MIASRLVKKIFNLAGPNSGKRPEQTDEGLGIFDLMESDHPSQDRLRKPPAIDSLIRFGFCFSWLHSPALEQVHAFGQESRAWIEAHDAFEIPALEAGLLG
jgi:hypothetical protein